MEKAKTKPSKDHSAANDGGGSQRAGEKLDSDVWEMRMHMTPEEATALREPFPTHMIGKLPARRGSNVQLDYVGHAAVTDRLLKVDPNWNWEPMGVSADGLPLLIIENETALLWIRLTVCGLTRLGVGTAPKGTFELHKQLIGDAIRNAAMRFGVALDLWSKEELLAPEERVVVSGPATPPQTTPAASAEPIEAEPASPAQIKAINEMSEKLGHPPLSADLEVTRIEARGLLDDLRKQLAQRGDRSGEPIETPTQPSTDWAQDTEQQALGE